jgi:hypothetical protein
MCDMMAGILSPWRSCLKPHASIDGETDASLASDDLQLAQEVA